MSASQECKGVPFGALLGAAGREQGEPLVPEAGQQVGQHVE